jgi:hypothetical protein
MKPLNFVISIILTLSIFVVLILWPVGAKAAPVTHILSIIFTKSLESTKPYSVSPFTSGEDCLIEAEKKNKTETEFLKNLGEGAEFACLKIQRVTV